ncbi:response regulator transcription factor [Cupriavidus sp. CV2]|uniref:response regulator transcription factor n=1 Tax=Cupriavidus ulmosensis TaxID=3065913 RepID=UPI00296A9E6E|nr:response regulator transcription factor [Cupriavidus sp. CV2]MDW3684327.1 response regulator transcription factor [Cupriavidus sp. CV2]
MTTVLIVDDHPAIHLILRVQLLQVLNVRNVLEASDGKAALDAARLRRPDLVILDLDIPDISGLEVIIRLRTLYPSLPILVLSGLSPAIFSLRAMRLGARGFVSKQRDMADIMRCVGAVLAGHSLLPGDPLSTGPHPGGRAGDLDRLQQLTDREITILQMLAKGMSNAEIAKLEYVSNKTVSSHKIRIMRKLEVTTLVELVDYARRYHLAM